VTHPGDVEERKRLHSGAYVQMYERKPISRIERLVPLMKLRGDESLADFACGNGMLLRLIHNRIAMYHGVDFSADFIESARRRAETHRITNCRFHCQDIAEFCSQHHGEFDVATAFDFSEHVDDVDFVRIFSAIRDSLKHGGRLLVHTPNLDFFMERLKDWGVLRQFPEHIAVRTASANRALLRNCGFAEDQIRAEGIAHYNVLRALHPLSRLPLLGGFLVARLVIECVR
jgi:2-polyprenyl-6-hydroxyphenyl methylase / 3-demethylubiquinone-9 3-methyltransferase